MAKEDSMKMLKAKIKVLKSAKKTLKALDADSGMGICYNLEHGYPYVYKWLAHPVEAVAAESIKKYIRYSLKKFAYLGDWMRSKKFDNSPDSVRKARLQWIDWMIASLKEDIKAKEND